MAAFAETRSDGIIQVSTSGGEFMSGPAGDMALGSITLAEHVHRVAERLPVYIALTTDHCVPDKVNRFLHPLIAETKRRREAGLNNLYNGHMFDGSHLPLDENMAQARDLLEMCAEQEIVLEVEAGVVGGEEDGIDNTNVKQEKLYTTPEDMLTVYESLKDIGSFTFAATFGNVHGVYKPGNVKLDPKILKNGQAAVTAKYGEDAKMFLVFHGGSGTPVEEVHETLDYGVIKMNVDTDCQYWFTRAIAGHMFENYDGVLRVDGEVGDKKVYDPRSYLKKATESMKRRVVQAIDELRSTGKTIYDA